MCENCLTPWKCNGPHLEKVYGTGPRDLNSLDGDPRFLDKLWEIAQLHASKQMDYGSDEDPFANIRSSVDFGVPAWVGALVRLNDKVTRLKQFSKKGVLQNESALDSMLDIAVYSLVAAILYQEEERGEV